ncbi:allophanate hydrolase subunit 1 [Streptomyces sp. NBC_00873]|uniref:5-oxoprolinase subunit B family protein n=1 Tax=unclassified Streptomyces TaxID=2593676 RepID=UPI0038640F19|nr:allophanate hydrolase subunit 1 [Streptomyces sp. NBC_00873]WTA41928.1 allophanate hydrolase subunit 1 [Streptomyces sp. NBC_00842]
MRAVAVRTTPTLRPCGDTGLLLELPDNRLVHAYAAAVRAARVAGVVDIVPALDTLLVLIDPRSGSMADVEARLREINVPDVAEESQRVVELPVRYDGEDLAWVAEHCGMEEREVVAAHTSAPWRVGFCGFAPGFAYLVGGDPRLHVPRRAEPRVVPAGAVALAGQFSSVYPRRSPGGWQLLGHTDVPMWDTSAEQPSLLLPGDQVVFREVAP